MLQIRHVNGVAGQHLYSFGCWFLGHLLLPVKICTLVHAQVGFATIVAVNPQHIAKCIHLNTLGWHCAVNCVVNELIAHHCKGLHMFSKCLQVGCCKFGGNRVATAGFFATQSFLAHCSCGCRRIDSNACLCRNEMFAAILTPMTAMINC